MLSDAYTDCHQIWAAEQFFRVMSPASLSIIVLRVSAQTALNHLVGEVVVVDVAKHSMRQRMISGRQQDSCDRKQEDAQACIVV